jgi:hypothetical protein
MPESLDIDEAEEVTRPAGCGELRPRPLAAGECRIANGLAGGGKWIRT